VLLLVIGVVVDAEDDRHVGVRRRRRDDHLLRARLEMLLRVLPLREEAGRLQNDVHAEVFPGERGGVALGEELELLVADADAAVDRLDLLVQRPEDGVVLEQVRHRLRIAEVVRGHEVDVRPPLPRGAEEIAPDAPETVDTHANAHRLPF
jgi:hypothetical protein